jgi:hypothetical protein
MFSMRVGLSWPVRRSLLSPIPLVRLGGEIFAHICVLLLLLLLFGGICVRYVSNNLGAQFVDPPAFDLNEVYELSNATTPLVFVLSPGVDPTKEVQALADQLGFRLDSCALGQVCGGCGQCVGGG